MAQSYDRRINLYINVDGKNIPNNVASIKAELQKIINQQARMTLGSKEYQEQTAKITYLRGILQQHNAEVNNIKKSWSLQGMADGFNRYMGLITAFAASATGLVLSFKQIVQSFNDYEERVDNLSALTGLAGDDLEWLSNKAKELSQSTLEGGIRVTQSAKDIIDAFTKTGSARPELLKNKEALVQVTEEAIILSNAAKTELQPAIEALTMVMNQYNVGADQARRIINVLAAGSKEGAGEIPYLTTAFEKAGTVASLANISIESLGAAIETLAPRITQPEIAGRSLKGVLLDLQTGSDDTNPAIVGLSTAIENLGKKNYSVTELTKKFGTENINTAQILIANIGEMKNYEKAMTGTNVALEQAAINTDNNNAKLAQARNKLNVMSIELGEKLAAALQVSTSGLSYLVKALSISIQFFTEHKVLIVSLVTSIISYNVAVKVATILEGGFNREKGIGLAITKLSVFWNNAASASMLLYQAAVALLAGNLARATRAMQLFWAFTRMTPVGALTAVVIGLGTALYMLSGRLTATQKAQQALNEVNLEAQKNIVEEKVKLGTLLDIARNEKLTKEQRLKAIAALNAINPQYINGLTLENINTKKADDSVKAYTESLLENARVLAAKEKIAEIDKQLLDLQSGNIDNVSFLEKARIRLAESAKRDYSAEKANAIIASKAIEDLTKQREKLVSIIEKQKIAELGGENPGGGNSAAQDLVKLKEKELANAQAIIATTPAEVAARNAKVEAIQKELNALNELGTSKQGDSGKKLDDDIIKKRIEKVEAANNAEVAAIKKRHLEGKTTEDQYNGELLSQELKFLSDKAQIYKVGSKEYEETQAQLLEKQVAAEKTVKDLLLKAQDELANAKIANLKEGIDKEKALEEQRWKEELDGLKKQLIEKENLSASEIALNDTTNKIIEEKTKAHQKVISDLTIAAGIQNQMDSALIAEAKAGSDQERWAAERELAQAQYQQELQDAQGNAVKIAQAEKNLSNKLIQIKTEELDRRQAIGDAVFGSANQLFGALVDLAGKESALGKALFLAQQAAAIGQVIFNTAIANAKAVAASPLTFGQPWVTINTITAGLSIASIVAQTIKGFAGGGFTDGDRIYRAGEAGTEWIAPNWMLQNPVTAGIIGGLEDWRKNPVKVSSMAYNSTKTMGNSAPAYVQNSTQPAEPTQIVVNGSSLSPEDIRRFADAVSRFSDKELILSMETFDRKYQNYLNLKNGGLKLNE